MDTCFIFNLLTLFWYLRDSARTSPQPPTTGIYFSHEEAEREVGEMCVSYLGF